MSRSAFPSYNTSTSFQDGVKSNLEPLAQTSTHTKELWKFRLRPDDDDEPQNWWFASTAIPLLAATTGPLANVMSISALITSWRCRFDPAYPQQDAKAIGFPDPRWCIGLNAASLACGFAGNIFLLLNFTRRVRYILALPMTIILWYFATGLVSAISPVSSNLYFLYRLSDTAKTIFRGTLDLTMLARPIG